MGWFGRAPLLVKLKEASDHYVDSCQTLKSTNEFCWGTDENQFSIYTTSWELKKTLSTSYHCSPFNSH
jgi:hypothetical protein